LTVTGTQQRVYGKVQRCVGYLFPTTLTFPYMRHVKTDSYYIHTRTISAPLYNKEKIKRVIVCNGMLRQENLKYYGDKSNGIICIENDDELSWSSIDDALWIENAISGSGLQFHNYSVRNRWPGDDKGTCTLASYGTVIGCFDITEIVNLNEDTFTFFMDTTSLYPNTLGMGDAVSYIAFIFDDIESPDVWVEDKRTLNYNILIRRYHQKACNHKASPQCQYEYATGWGVYNGTKYDAP